MLKLLFLSMTFNKALPEHRIQQRSEALFEHGIQQRPEALFEHGIQQRSKG